MGHSFHFPRVTKKKKRKKKKKRGGGAALERPRLEDANNDSPKVGQVLDFNSSSEAHFIGPLLPGADDIPIFVEKLEKGGFAALAKSTLL